MLAWSHAISYRKRKNLSASDPALHLQESISDLIQSQILILLGVYKSGRGSLRSSVENFFRFVCLAQGQSISRIKSTYDLIREARSITNKNNPQIASALHQITLVYDDLCKHVHTSSKGHMALINAVESNFRYRKSSFDNCCDQTQIFCSNASRIAFWLRSQALNNLGHRLRDFVLDSIPKHLKNANTNR
jgi:hypothetical protein